MQTPSAFQLQFPLSQKKIWKKMIGPLVSSVLLVLFFGGLLVFLGVMTASAPEATVRVSGLVVGLLVLALLYVLANFLYWSAYIRGYFYSADENFITIRKGVFSATEIHVQYAKIQDVYVDQDIVDRLMGLYDVHIASATATSGIEAHIDGVDAQTADGLKNLLLGRITNASTMQQKTFVAPAVPTQGQTVVANTDPALHPSSETYPIDAKWYLQTIVGQGLFSLFLALVLGFRASGEFTIPIIIFVSTFLIQAVGALLWKATFSWKFTNEYIQMNEGVLSRKETHLPYHTIQDVVLNQSIIERVVGLCTVRVENAANVSSGNNRQSAARGIRFPGQPLAKGQELVEMVRKIRTGGGHGNTGL